MNLDDVRKSLPKNTPKKIWDLYQQLFDVLENENVNNITSDGFTIFIQAADPHDRYYQQFVGKTFELYNTHHISKEEEQYLGVEGCDYVGEINVNGEIQPIPFVKNSVNSKIPISFEWIYAGYIKSKIQESKYIKKDNKKDLYESIITSVAREVKKALNEEYNSVNESVSTSELVKYICYSLNTNKSEDEEEVWRAVLQFKDEHPGEPFRYTVSPTASLKNKRNTINGQLLILKIGDDAWFWKASEKIFEKI